MKSITRNLLGLALAASLALSGGCSPSLNHDSYAARENFRRLQAYNPKNECDIAFYLDSNFDYTPDNHFLFLSFDKWQSPRTSVARLKGDCDDFAFLACNLAEKLGYPPELLCLNSLFNAHMLALLHDKERGRFGVLGRCEYIEPVYDSVDSLILNGINPKTGSNFTHYKIIYPDNINKEWRTITKDLTITINPLTLKKVKRH